MNEPPCYVFKRGSEQPSKRRRIDTHFSEDDLRVRLESYELEWKLQAEGFEEAVRNATRKPLEEVIEFISSMTKDSGVAKLPTGFIVTSPSASSGFLEQVQDRVLERKGNTFATLRPSDGPNLKSLLKNLVQRTTSSLLLNEDDEEDRKIHNLKGPRLLNYDLQILYDWSKSRGIDKIIVALRDSEAFDVNVFSDFVSVLHSWLDRIQFVLLIGVATSIDIFQDRLPPSAIKNMSGKSFDVTETTEILEQAFKCSTAAEGCTLHPGPGFADFLIQRSKDHVQSVGPVMQSVKYAYMCHFYGNPIAAFLKQNLRPEDLSDAHFEVIRNLPSFKVHVEQLLENGKASLVRELLSSNSTLFLQVIKSIPEAHARMEWLCGAISVIHTISESFGLKTRTSISFSNLYIRSLSGTLTMTTPLIRELLLHAKLATKSTIETALDSIITTMNNMPSSSTISLTPEFFTILLNDLPKITLATLQTRFHALLSAYLAETLLSGQYTSHIPFHEIYFYDLKLLHRDAFTPRPRFAIERALSRPHDYLGCNCCSGPSQENQGGESRRLYENGTAKGKGKALDKGTANHPATAILYQLTVESGTLVNVQDLWSAFRARVEGSAGESNMPFEDNDYDVVVSNGNGNKSVAKDEKSLPTRALFFRGLAELKYLGVVRQSRKKTDCLQKVLWGGL